ncbi:MAG: hypothetical protein IJ831_06935 [Spirochaetales bacterium]|nr:hypothetical protein [Spirochaetales bacterium]
MVGKDVLSPKQMMQVDHELNDRADSAKYLYGFYGLSGLVRKKVEEGKWILGGCVISGTKDFSKRYCKACNRDFYIS